MKLDLLTNATVVDEAIRFVSSQKSKDNERLKLCCANRHEHGAEELHEPDYHKYDDQLEEEKQEEKTGEITTTNQVFSYVPLKDYFNSNLYDTFYLVQFEYIMFQK